MLQGNRSCGLVVQGLCRAAASIVTTNPVWIVERARERLRHLFRILLGDVTAHESAHPIGRLAARPVDERFLHVIYLTWLGVFALKSIGAAWDIAWHVRFVRDDFAPPHLINSFGTGVGVSLLVLQTWTRRATEPVGLRMMQVGLLIFLAAIPLDLLSHRLFGIDITTWSATHMLLYIGTALMLAGALRSVLRLALPGRWRLGVALGFWVFLLDAVLFPLGQQEYGTLALADYLRGDSTASLELQALAANNIIGLALGGVPAWVYPVWLILGASSLLLVAQAVQGWRWTATTVTSCYLGMRLIGYWLLVAGEFPRSFVPIMVLGGAILIDLQAYWRWRRWATAVGLVCVFYGSAVVIGQFALMPAFPLISAPVVGLVLWQGWEAVVAATARASRVKR
jgi:hypothetical protein